ncbi:MULTISPECIES: hypothetical protein [Bacillus]|uniref:hypothetical protein n=1 Tax=Bacillus TaxID=1386 RepID=UPI001E3DA756|nr:MULTISPECIES: hypothetical protein [Bacillus]
MDTKTAMSKAKEAVTLTADAAAFYDKSYEDASSSLNSFIKGNYEGGESIGLFANETQLASWASKNLGADWKKLDEAGKQVARLEYAKAMQKMAGATGQAKRESNSYENQLGNLKQSWTDLKAKLATPILTPVINGLKSMADWLSKIDTDAVIAKVSAFGSYMRDTFAPVFNDSKIAVEGIWTAFQNVGGVALAKDLFDGVKTGLAWIKDNSSLVVAGVVGITGALVAFKIISSVSAAISFFNGLMVAYRTGTLLAKLATYGLNTALLANPFTWVAVAIGLLIAAGVLLYKNWDKVKVKAGELWSKVKEVFGGIYDWAVQKIQPVTDYFKGLYDKFVAFKNAITSFKPPAWVSKIGGAISGAVSKVSGFIDGSHAGGLSHVPKNNYVARLHKGERVLTPEENKEYRQGNAGGNSYQFGNIIIQGTGYTEQDADRLLDAIARRIELAGGAGA